METRAIDSGVVALDELLQEMRLGDNVVWQVDSLADYRYFAEPFVDAGIRQGYPVVYVRFAPGPALFADRPGMEVVEVDPRPGFDYFSRAVHQIIEDRGTEVLYVFDPLSALVSEWATDELVANFFQVTCPYLFELDTVTYFALTRGQHAHSAVARIRDTTQLLLDVYHAEGQMYIHPLKVWDRYSPQMFLPHRVAGSSWQPVAGSGDAAAVAITARKNPLADSVRSIAPWESVYHKLVQYRGLSDEELGAHPELVALKQELTRMMIGNHPRFSALADRYFTVDALLGVRERMVGSGRIGGKAAGMLLARRILLSPPPAGQVDLAPAMEDHDSFYIGSDVFFTFLVENDLFRLRLQLTKNSQLSHAEFAEVEERFLAGHFPAPIMNQFAQILDYFGQAPIIIRSSSLLEDSFGNAFAGKYRSEFCANQGSPEQRLQAFLRAVKLVYASALNPDALSYRRKRGLGESDEQMAILVQRVSGRPTGRLFFPTIAGVAFSRNLYAWNDRIDPSKGMIRLVHGLGTRAVDRVDSDYPRMVAVSHPSLRPEVGLKAAKYSQRQVDVLDLDSNALATLPITQVFSECREPWLHYLISTVVDGDLQDPISNYIEARPQEMVLTFNRLIQRTSFVKLLGAMLARLEAAYGRPVDTEFTASIARDGSVRINLLQCRPLFFPGSNAVVSSSANLNPERILFRSNSMIRGGEARDMRYILYIDPRHYNAITDEEKKRALGRVVGRINDHPDVAEGGIVMMGPGRWGSSNLHLGVNVGYADINNAGVLVEIAREEAGQLPEVSYGTHFFQDLVEAQVIFLALYPGTPESHFNAEFFENTPNSLTDLLPDAADFAEVLQVFDVPATTGGAYVHVVADSQAQNAVCFLDNRTDTRAPLVSGAREILNAILPPEPA